MPNPQIPKVYLFSAGQYLTGDHLGIAIAEDGETLGEHICSHPGWFRHDLHDRDGIRDTYVGKYGLWGDGDRYEVVECAYAEVPAEVQERHSAWIAAELDRINTRPNPSAVDR